MVQLNNWNLSLRI